MNFRLMKRTPMYQVTRGIVLRRQCGQPSQTKFENLSCWCIDWFKKSHSCVFPSKRPRSDARNKPHNRRDRSVHSRSNQISWFSRMSNGGLRAALARQPSSFAANPSARFEGRLHERANISHISFDGLTGHSRSIQDRGISNGTSSMADSDGN